MNLALQKEKLSAQIISLEERILTNKEIAAQKNESSSEDDIATVYEMQAKAQAAIKIDRNMLGNTRSAIRRIDTGDYEYCNSCGDDINPKRLEANPVATTCIECAHLNDIKRR